MNELQRHRLTYKVLVPIVRVYLRLQFNYRYEDIGKIEGPYLLVANHNLELDPALIGVAVGKQLYFVASEHLLRKGIATWALMRYFKPIIHKKGKQGAQTIKQMIRTLKEGHSVCIFPEGNRSFNGVTMEMLPAIGRMARISGAKLVTYRVEGGYLTQPRWSLSLRRGRMQGRLIREYSVEELKTMTDEQVNKAIREDLYEDAYATQERDPVAFRGKNLALGMEATLFTCPECGKSGTLHSDATHLFCDCGFKAEYDVYGYLTDGNGRKYTITELDRMQRAALEAALESYEGEAPIFSDRVTCYDIDGNHETAGEQNGTIEAYADRLEICGRSVPYGKVQGMAIYSRNALIIHFEGKEGHVEIKSDKTFCALKYLYLYEAKGKQGLEK